MQDCGSERKKKINAGWGKQNSRASREQHFKGSGNCFSPLEGLALLKKSQRMVRSRVESGDGWVAESDGEGKWRQLYLNNNVFFFFKDGCCGIKLYSGTEIHAATP